MKPCTFGLLSLLLALVIACSAAVTPAEPAQLTREDSSPEESTGREEDAQALHRQRLEQALEKLNGVITDTPSRYHHERAGVLFRMDRFEEAVKDYDMAVRFGRPHSGDSCWERGLALYYTGDFRGGEEQFYRYHRVGPLDIENGLWRFLCIAEEEGTEKAREAILDYSQKVRMPFPALLDLYLERGTAEAVVEQAKERTPPPRQLTTNLFYAHYYIGKYYEIIEDEERALLHVREALKHSIAHFMYACAQADERRLAARKNAEPKNSGASKVPR